MSVDAMKWLMYLFSVPRLNLKRPDTLQLHMEKIGL